MYLPGGPPGRDSFTVLLDSLLVSLNMWTNRLVTTTIVPDFLRLEFMFVVLVHKCFTRFFQCIGHVYTDTTSKCYFSIMIVSYHFSLFSQFHISYTQTSKLSRYKPSINKELSVKIVQCVNIKLWILTLTYKIK